MTTRPVLAIPSPRGAPVTYAAMAAEDMAAVCQIERESFRPAMSCRRLAQLARMRAGFVFRVLRAPSRAAGAGSGAAPQAYSCCCRAGSVIHIVKLGCLKAARGQGLGKGLLLSLLQEMIQAQAEEAHLEVRASNGVARRLYLGAGFRVDGRQRRGYLDGEDGLRMSLTRMQEPSRRHALAQQCRAVMQALQRRFSVPEEARR